MFVVTFTCDILAYSQNEEDYADHLRSFSQTIKARKLFGKFSKCEFQLWSHVTFLGHFVFSDGIRVDPQNFIQ